MFSSQSVSFTIGIVILSPQEHIGAFVNNERFRQRDFKMMVWTAFGHYVSLTSDWGHKLKEPIVTIFNIITER